MEIESGSLSRFFTKLKIIFGKIPIKARFLKDLEFNVSYSGFRYFMQDRKPSPSTALMNNLCDTMGYEFVTIPIKKSIDQQVIKENLENHFFGDLDNYLKKYDEDPSRIYTKDLSDQSTVGSAVDAFSVEDVFDVGDEITVADLF